MQRVLLVADDDGVAGVVAAVELHDPVGALTEEVGGLALALVPPLDADDDDAWHGSLLGTDPTVHPILSGGRGRPAERGAQRPIVGSRSAGRLSRAAAPAADRVAHAALRRVASVWSVARLAMARASSRRSSPSSCSRVSDAIEAGATCRTIVANFFSFFTIRRSNAATVIVLATAAVWYCARGTTRVRPSRAGSRFLLASVTTYMVITGIVYNTLLRGIALEPGSIVAWSNEVLHLVGPAVPPRRPPRRTPAPRAAVAHRARHRRVFPLVWVGVHACARAPFIVIRAPRTPSGTPTPSSTRTVPAGGGSVVVLRRSASRWRSSPSRARRVDRAPPWNLVVDLPHAFCPPFGPLRRWRCQVYVRAPDYA